MLFRSPPERAHIRASKPLSEQAYERHAYHTYTRRPTPLHTHVRVFVFVFVFRVRVLEKEDKRGRICAGCWQRLLAEAESGSAELCPKSERRQRWVHSVPSQRSAYPRQSGPECLSPERPRSQQLAATRPAPSAQRASRREPIARAELRTTRWPASASGPCPHACHAPGSGRSTYLACRGTWAQASSSARLSRWK